MSRHFAKICVRNGKIAVKNRLKKKKIGEKQNLEEYDLLSPSKKKK